MFKKFLIRLGALPLRIRRFLAIALAIPLNLICFVLIFVNFTPHKAFLLEEALWPFFSEAFNRTELRDVTLMVFASRTDQASTQHNQNLQYILEKHLAKYIALDWSIFNLPTALQNEILSLLKQKTESNIVFNLPQGERNEARLTEHPFIKSIESFNLITRGPTSYLIHPRTKEISIRYDSRFNAVLDSLEINIFAANSSELGSLMPSGLYFSPGALINNLDPDRGEKTEILNSAFTLYSLATPQFQRTSLAKLFDGDGQLMVADIKFNTSDNKNSKYLILGEESNHVLLKNQAIILDRLSNLEIVRRLSGEMTIYLSCLLLAIGMMVCFSQTNFLTLITLGLSPAPVLVVANLITLSSLSTNPIALPLTAPCLLVLVSTLNAVFMRAFFEWWPQSVFKKQLGSRAKAYRLLNPVNDIFVKPQRREISLLSISAPSLNSELEKLEADQIYQLKAESILILKDTLLESGAYILEDTFSRLSACWNLIANQPNHKQILEEFLLTYYDQNKDSDSLLVCAGSGMVVCAPEEEGKQSALMLGGRLLTNLSNISEIARIINLPALYLFNEGHLYNKEKFLDLGLFQLDPESHPISCLVPLYLLKIDPRLLPSVSEAFLHFRANQLGLALKLFLELKGIPTVNFFYEKLTTQMTSLDGMDQPIWRLHTTSAKPAVKG